MFKPMLFITILCSFFISIAHSKDLHMKQTHQIHYVEMDDKIKLEVIDWGGKQQTLVFLAGLSLNAHTFEHIATKFTDTHRVIGITRVGHGNSDTREEDFSFQRLSQDIINVLDNLQIDSAIFAGHSVAGGELTYLGKHFPNRVEGLIYIDALQAIEFMDSHIAVCPDITSASIEMFQHKEHFYRTQRIKTNDGAFMPFADLNALGQIMTEEKKQVHDYTNILAPALAINHIPEQTDNFFLGLETPSQQCREELNKLTYLGIAEFIKHKPNADVAAIQNSQHMIHKVTPEKLVIIMKSWLARVFATNKAKKSDSLKSDSY